MKTILVVHDDPEMRNMERGMLESMGYKVMEADDGHTALGIILSGRVYGVIADNDPGMGPTGYETLVSVRERGNGASSTPFVLCSNRCDNYGNTVQVDEIARKGAEVLIKPFGVEAYKDAVRKAFGFPETSAQSVTEF